MEIKKGQKLPLATPSGKERKPVRIEEQNARNTGGRRVRIYHVPVKSAGF